MRTFVDGNGGSLTREAISSHCTRIFQEHELLTSFTQLDIIDVMIRFYQYRGSTYGVTRYGDTPHQLKLAAILEEIFIW